MRKKHFLNRLFLLVMAISVLTPPYATIAASFAYVCNRNDSTVSVIDTATNTVTATIPAGGWNLSSIAVNPTGSRVYVAGPMSNSVSVIDTNINILVSTIGVGKFPNSVAINPAGTNVYVSNNLDSTVSVIDTATNTVTATIPVEGMPDGIVVNPAGTKVYVANNAGFFSVINTATNTVTAKVTLGNFPNDIAVNPEGTRVYVTDSSDNTVSIINTSNNAVVVTIPVGQFPTDIAVNPAGTLLYVTNLEDDTISVINTSNNRVVNTIVLGDGPRGIAVSPDGTFVYVTNSREDTVSVIDTATNVVVDTISVGMTPFDVAIGPDRGPIPTGDIQFTGLTTDLISLPVINSTITFTALCDSSDPIYYKFWQRFGYGTPAYDSNSWLVLGDFNPRNTAGVNHAYLENYILVVWATNDPNNIPLTVPIIGMNVNIGGNLQFTGLTTTLTGTPGAGSSITFNATCIGPGSINYKFWYRAGYGTSAYDANPWVVMQDFSGNNTCTYSFPSAGDYIVVVWVVNDPNNIPPGHPIIGMHIKVKSQ